MIDVVMISKVIRIDIGQIVEIGDSTEKTVVDQGMNKIIEEEILEVMQENINFERKNSKGHTEIIEERNIIAEVEIGTGLEKDHFLETLVMIKNNRSTSISRSRAGSKASTNRDRIRYYKCREYDHLAKDCPTSREERELEQLQQMLNIDGEQTSLKSLVTNTHDNLNK